MKMNSHLNSVNESYFQHMRHALSFTLGMAVGALCCLIHAIFPFLFENAGSQIVQRLHDRMVLNRANLSSPQHSSPDGASQSPSSSQCRSE